jgi:hypothetical protein
MSRTLQISLAVATAALVVAMLGLWAAGGGAQAGERGYGTAEGIGVATVDGREVHVEVYLAVAPGVDAAEQVRQELRARGARPLEPSEFATTGLVWNQFSDDVAGNEFVTQYYNPGSASTVADPTGGGGETALLNTHATWNNVTTSDFALAYGGTTTRCPSLVQECPGDQVFDGFNDVAWLDLGRCSIARCTLAVTWFSTSDPDEADMAMNTRVAWRTNGSDYDVETVMLHENGHVAGLGHSSVTAAVMYAYYGGVRRALHQDDIDGISFLYPASGEPADTSTPTNTPQPTDTPPPTNTATPTDTPDPNEPTATSTFTPTATNTPEPFCPPGHQRRGLC